MTAPGPNNTPVPGQGASSNDPNNGGASEESRQGDTSVDMSSVPWKDAKKLPISDPRMRRAYRRTSISLLVTLVLTLLIALVMFFTVPWSTRIEINVRARGETNMSMLMLLGSPAVTALFYFTGTREVRKIERNKPERLISKRELYTGYMLVTLFALLFLYVQVMFATGFLHNAGFIDWDLNVWPWEWFG